MLCHAAWNAGMFTKAWHSMFQLVLRRSATTCALSNMQATKCAVSQLGRIIICFQATHRRGVKISSGATAVHIKSACLQPNVNSSEKKKSHMIFPTCNAVHSVGQYKQLLEVFFCICYYSHKHRLIRDRRCWSKL